jgi:hypothetical protein
MSNVMKFPKKCKLSPMKVSGSHITRIKAATPRGITAGSILSFVWLLVRLPVFLVLYWLRLPVMLVCNFISIPSLAAFLFSWYAFPDKTPMVVAFGVVSFLAFTLMYIYDLVLMALSPQDIVRTL